MDCEGRRGSSARTRTWNLAVNSRPLCRLSYRGRPRDYTAPTSSVKPRGEGASAPYLPVQEQLVLNRLQVELNGLTDICDRLLVAVPLADAPGQGGDIHREATFLAWL